MNDVGLFEQQVASLQRVITNRGLGPAPKMQAIIQLGATVVDYRDKVAAEFWPYKPPMLDTLDAIYGVVCQMGNVIREGYPDLVIEYLPDAGGEIGTWHVDGAPLKLEACNGS